MSAVYYWGLLGGLDLEAEARLRDSGGDSALTSAPLFSPIRLPVQVVRVACGQRMSTLTHISHFALHVWNGLYL